MKVSKTPSHCKCVKTLPCHRHTTLTLLLAVLEKNWVKQQGLEIEYMLENDLRQAYSLRKYLNLKSITLNFLNILQYGFGLIRYSILYICCSRAFLHFITMIIHLRVYLLKDRSFSLTLDPPLHKWSHPISYG